MTRGHQSGLADRCRPKCPQPDGLNNTLDFGPIIPFPDCGEDELNCLNLNVYRPTNVDGSVTLPVLFWIHG
jgi:carboxylesterase type B